jgi:non-specific serine/threonine protein kinase
VREATARLRAAGDHRDLSVTLSRMAFFAISQEQYAQASAMLTEAMTAARMATVPYPIAVILGNQGLAALFQDALDDAAAAFAAQLEICVEHVFSRLTPEPLAGLAAVAARRGNTERAARLFGAATALGFAPKGADARVYRRLIDHFLAPARVSSDPATWDAEHANGSRLTLEEAINSALETPNSNPTETAGAGPVTRSE